MTSPLSPSKLDRFRAAVAARTKMAGPWTCERGIGKDKGKVFFRRRDASGAVVAEVVEDAEGAHVGKMPFQRKSYQGVFEAMFDLDAKLEAAEWEIVAPIVLDEEVRRRR